MVANPIDRLDVPAYSGPQAAHYVGVPYGTLRTWVSDHGLISVPEPNTLSFTNLAEAHVLKAMRKKHGLSLQAIRKALLELSHLRKTQHPLLEESFETDGISLCIHEQEQVINLSRCSQREIREFVSIYLHRVERNSERRVSRLYPFVTTDERTSAKSVSISPAVSFGRPVLLETGISTALLAGRFKAGESLSSLAQEFQVEQSALEDAIRWEMPKGKAA